MSDAPLFQNGDEQPADVASSEDTAEDQSITDESVAFPAGLAPGMQTGAGPTGMPGVLPPQVAPIPGQEEDANTDLNT